MMMCMMFDPLDKVSRQEENSTRLSAGTHTHTRGAKVALVLLE